MTAAPAAVPYIRRSTLRPSSVRRVRWTATTSPEPTSRMAATIAKVADELSEGGLIRRTKAKVDGPNEGAFLACSCWMADCLTLQGRHEEAVAQFERLLAVGNDLGLFAEQYNVPARHMTGNFPQALTHLAIVNTALSLCGPVLNRGA